METLIQYDTLIFEWINNGWSSAFLDWIAPIWRNKYFWIPLYIFIFLFLGLNFKRQGLIVIIGLILTAGISDYTSSSIIKPTVERTRPCNDESLTVTAIERINCGSGFSFPSSHATNHFGIACFLGLSVLSLGRIWMYILLFWALTISLAQVYVGVHFPIDIIAGAILGSTIAILIWSGFKKLFKMDLSQLKKQETKQVSTS